MRPLRPIPKLAADVTAWDEIAQIQKVRKQLFLRRTRLSGRAFRDGLLGYALTLVQAASERSKPNQERLPEYTDQALVGVQQDLSAPFRSIKIWKNSI